MYGNQRCSHSTNVMFICMPSKGKQRKDATIYFYLLFGTLMGVRAECAAVRMESFNFLRETEADPAILYKSGNMQIFQQNKSSGDQRWSRRRRTVKNAVIVGG